MPCIKIMPISRFVMCLPGQSAWQWPWPGRCPLRNQVQIGAWYPGTRCVCSRTPTWPGPDQRPAVICKTVFEAAHTHPHLCWLPDRTYRNVKADQNITSDLGSQHATVCLFNSSGCDFQATLCMHFNQGTINQYSFMMAQMCTAGKETSRIQREA